MKIRDTVLTALESLTHKTDQFEISFLNLNGLLTKKISNVEAPNINEDKKQITVQNQAVLSQIVSIGHEDAILVVEFSIFEMDIGFSIHKVQVTGEQVPVSEYQTVSSENPSFGTIVCKLTPGIYLLKWHNQYSLINSKLV